MSEVEVVESAENVVVEPAKAKQVRRQRVEFAQFVEAFKDSKSYDDVAQKTGMSVQSVRVRASNYRKKQIHIPRFSAVSHTRRIDVAEANAFIERVMNTQDLTKIEE